MDDSELEVKYDTNVQPYLEVSSMVCITMIWQNDGSSPATNQQYPSYFS